jgi:hypothetical protein
MAQDQAKPSGPDLVQGIALAELQDGRMLAGHAAGEQVLLVRLGTEVFRLSRTNILLSRCSTDQHATGLKAGACNASPVILTSLGEYARKRLAPGFHATFQAAS